MFKKIIFSCCLFGCFFSAKAQNFDPEKYIIENEKDIAIEQASPHKGNGLSIGHSFFSAAKDFKINFRKRVLKPNSSIGYHIQKEDEVYYIVSGNGIMTLSDKDYNVTDGDAILTRTGSGHGLKNIGKNDLVIMIVYEKKQH